MDEDQLATWLVGDYRTEKFHASVTGDEVVVLTVWCVDLDKPGIFAIPVEQAKEMAGFLMAAALGEAK